MISAIIQAGEPTLFLPLYTEPVAPWPKTSLILHTKLALLRISMFVLFPSVKLSGKQDVFIAKELNRRHFTAYIRALLLKCSFSTDRQHNRSLWGKGAAVIDNIQERLELHKHCELLCPLFFWREGREGRAQLGWVSISTLKYVQVSNVFRRRFYGIYP